MYRTRVHPKNGAPTRDDVAREANISGATVSRVLSGRTDLPISPETRARVLEAAEKLGYRPNPSARALMTRRTGLVGFWMSMDYSRYRGQVLERMKTVLASTDLALAVSDVDIEYQSDHCFSRALRVPVEGIIAFDTSASIEAFAKDYHRLAPNTPFVAMGAYWAESVSYVGVDLRAGAEAAMDHLLGARKRIAYMAPSNSDLLNSGPRYEAYISKMSEAGLETSVIQTNSRNPADAKEALSAHFAGGKGPDAIFCMNDDLAIAASLGAASLGIRVGHDLAIVGFDGIEEAEYSPCPLTTVRQPVEEMCALAWKSLQAQMEDPSAPLQQTILKPELVIRDSSRA